MKIKKIGGSLLCILAGSAQADMSIMQNIPDVSANEGSALYAQVSNIPLKSLLLSMYPGFAVNLNQVNNMSVSIDKTQNTAISILQQISKKYDLSFDVNPDKQVIEVKPASNITYQSYLTGWQDLQHRANLLNKTQMALEAQKKALEKAYADSPYPVPKIAAAKEKLHKKKDELILVISPFISPELKHEITQQYHKHLLGEGFKSYLNKHELHYYENDATHKITVAVNLNTAKILSQANVYFAFKGNSMKHVIKEWGQQNQLSINTDVLPDAILKANVMYAGALTSNNSGNNPLYQLIADTLGWEKSNV